MKGLQRIPEREFRVQRHRLRRVRPPQGMQVRESGRGARRRRGRQGGGGGGGGGECSCETAPEIKGRMLIISRDQFLQDNLNNF